MAMTTGEYHHPGCIPCQSGPFQLWRSSDG